MENTVLNDIARLESELQKLQAIKEELLFLDAMETAYNFQLSGISSKEDC